MDKASLTPAVLWFRQDLRLSDNPALAAIDAGRPLIPLYVLDDETGRRSGAAARWWLNKSLAALDGDLRARGSRLILRRGPAAHEVLKLVEETGAKGVFWNRLYDPAQVARDKAIKIKLAADHVEVRSFNSALMNEPWEVLNGDGAPYKVFTPYWRAARTRLGNHRATTAPKQLTPPSQWPVSLPLDDLGLHPHDPDWSEGFGEWRPGEAGARIQLASFIAEALSSYREDRNRPGRGGSSRLSPHLHFGEISPSQVRQAVDDAVERGAPAGDAETFLSELGWRDFDHSLLFHQPDIAVHPMKPSLNGVNWRQDQIAFSAWTRGQTGYPLIDAGMRQLWTTGWMHNRVRMAVASFLVKHLLIDWRQGEAWFWDTLIDADAANNPANWQWVAGCGADAQPWFRVFNPVLQGEKFDPDGAYVRKFVPELARLPNARIHKPWTATTAELKACGVELGKTYPFPVVDHATARARALDAVRNAL